MLWSAKFYCSANLFLLVYRAALHHHHRILQQSHVFERITVYGNDVGKVSILNGTDLGPSQQISGIHGGRLDGLKRRHPNLYVHRKLMRVYAVWINGGVGTERNLYAG